MQSLRSRMVEGEGAFSESKATSSTGSTGMSRIGGTGQIVGTGVEAEDFCILMTFILPDHASNRDLSIPFRACQCNTVQYSTV